MPFLQTNTNRIWSDGYTAPPTEGVWNVGDIVLNASPTAGGFMGWVCLQAGTPGVWKTFGPISN